MDYLENGYAEKKPLLKRVFSLQTLLFTAGYIAYIVISRIKLYAGDFILQESGELDSVTSYDYILPIVNSLSTLIILGIFLLSGFFAYNKDKIKMLRFPMAFCYSSAIASFFSIFFMALYNSPIINYDEISFNIVGASSVAVSIIRLVSALAFFLYFDSETENDYYALEDYYQYSSRKSLRDKIISHRFCVLWVVLIVSEGANIIANLVRTGVTSALMLVPDEFLWVSYYIDVIFEIVLYTAYFLLAWYFIRILRRSVKLIGIILTVANLMDTFSFVFNSITNAFGQAGDHWINSVFSSVFVNVAASVFSVVRIVLLVLLCLKLKKSEDQYS